MLVSAPVPPARGNLWWAWHMVLCCRCFFLTYIYIFVCLGFLIIPFLRLVVYGGFFSFWSTLLVSSHLIFMYGFCKFCSNRCGSDMCVWVAWEQCYDSTKLSLPYRYIIHTRVGAEKDDSQIFAMWWCTCILWSYLPDLKSMITHLHTHDRVRVKALRPRGRCHDIMIRSTFSHETPVLGPFMPQPPNGKSTK
jgi:hypothetical protein